MKEDVLDIFEVATFEVDSSKLLDDDIRFNADYFLSSKNISFRTNLEFKPLSEYAKVIFPGIFKRILVDIPQYGIPFIATSGMMEYAPEPEKFLSKDLTTNLDIYRVEEDWILVSRSGTIGNTVFTSKVLTPFAITEDALRVIPNNKSNVGFLYFYISSDYGNDSIVGKKGGAVVDHIYEEDLLRLPIPSVSDEVVGTLQKKYEVIKNLRVEANDLLQEANRLVFEYNHLPYLNIDRASFPEDGRVLTRIINPSEIRGEYRLDAHFYNPIAELAEKNIREFSNEVKTLSELTKRIFYLNRFARTFVEKAYGIPYLAGKDIIKIRPSQMDYLSKQETEGLDNYFLEKGWILLTCSGTIGRTCFIWNNYEKFVATHDLIRIVPNENIDAGYLNAFLSSDYGYHQIVRYKHGAVIDHITPDQVALIPVPIPNDKQKQKIIGDKVRLAYEKRAEAIHLEDEGQGILKQFLTE